jgi:hypothetical protein
MADLTPVLGARRLQPQDRWARSERCRIGRAGVAADAQGQLLRGTGRAIGSAPLRQRQLDERFVDVREARKARDHAVV